MTNPENNALRDEDIVLIMKTSIFMTYAKSMTLWFDIHTALKKVSHQDTEATAMLNQSHSRVNRAITAYVEYAFRQKPNGGHAEFDLGSGYTINIVNKPSLKSWRIVIMRHGKLYAAYNWDDPECVAPNRLYDVTHTHTVCKPVE